MWKKARKWHWIAWTLAVAVWPLAAPQAFGNPMVVGAPAVGAAAPHPWDAGDSYLYRGGRIRLLRARGEYALEYAPGIKAAQGFEAVRKSLPAAATLTRIGTCRPANMDVVQSDVAGALTKLRTGPVRRVYPVLVYAPTMARMVATDEVLVCLKPGTAPAVLRDRLAALGAAVVRREPLPNAETYLARLADPDATGALEAAEALSAWTEVEWAEPNFYKQAQLHFTPNDPLFPKQQYLHNTGRNGGTPGADADAAAAWDLTRGSAGITIAILDDGVDLGHPDLNIAPGGRDFVNNDMDPSPLGADGHGTGCAGVAAAIGNNGVGMSGVAPNCRILPIKISESGVFIPADAEGNAIRYAADRADILSCSWGGESPNSYTSTALAYAAANGRDGKGCPAFFSTGNSASDWARGGGRFNLELGGLGLTPGTYRFDFAYQKDGDLVYGEDCAWIDNVCLLESDLYTHRWRQDFEGTFPPAGWSLFSSTNAATELWFRLTTSGQVMHGIGGAASVRSGFIGNNGFTTLQTPAVTLNGNECLRFNFRTSSYFHNQNTPDPSDDVGDFLYVDIENASGIVVSTQGGMAGECPVSTAVQYPASDANAMAVGASTDCDRRADYSQYGPELAFVAPSNGGWNDVITLDPRGALGWNATDYKTNFGGTSTACPLAAGIAALMLSQNPDLSAAEIRSLMHRSCDKIGGVTYTGGEAGAGGRHNEYGYGRINAFKAVTAAGTPGLQPPVHLSPADNSSVTGDEVTLAWNAVSGATHYVTQMAEDNGFSSPYTGNEDTATSTVWSGLPEDETRLYWRVRAGTAAAWSDWSQPWSFISAGGTTLQPPSLVSPANGATVAGTEVRMDWNSVAGAATYDCQIADNPQFTGASTSNPFPDPYVTWTDLPNDGTIFYWRARAGDGAGHWSAYSAAWHFINGPGQSVPAAPGNVSATDGTLSACVRVTWSPAARATEYRVYRCESANVSGATALGAWVSGTTFDDYSAQAATQGSTGCAGSSSPVYRRYYYWVRARNAAGSGPYSAPDMGYRGLSKQGRATSAGALSGTAADLAILLTVAAVLTFTGRRRLTQGYDAKPQ